MTIGDRIKKRRTCLGLTLEDVAKTSGVSRQTIQRYESGVISNIPSDRIEKIAEALSVSPAYLMGWLNNDGFLEKQPFTIPHTKNLSILSDMNITTEEIQIISKYRQLDTHGKKTVDFILDNEHQRSVQLNVPVEDPERKLEIEDEDVDLGASAVIKPYDGPNKEIVNRILQEDVEEEYERLYNELALRGYLGNEDEDKKESKK